MNKNKINIIFIVLMSATFVAGALITIINWINYSPYSSAPEWVNIAYFIPFGVAIIIELIIWLILKKKFDNSNMLKVNNDKE